MYRGSSPASDNMIAEWRTERYLENVVVNYAGDYHNIFLQGLQKPRKTSVSSADVAA
jgi:hypothetical protein